MTTWPYRGRAWLLVGQAACLATITLAGRASAQRPSPAGQGSWVALAIVAALISAAGNGVWLGTLRRAASRRRQLVVALLAGQVETSTAASAGATSDAGRSVMVPGLTLRHRPDCELVAGKTVVPAPPDTDPCGWCSP